MAKKSKGVKFSRRRKNGLTMTVEDEYGALQPLPMSTETAQETLGGGILVDRSKSFASAAKWTIRLGGAAIIITILLTTFSSIMTLMSNSETRGLAEKAQSTAFKTRYQDLGKGVIDAYYSGKPPVTSLMSDVTWSTVGGAEQIGLTQGQDSTGTSSGGSSNGTVTGTKVQNISYMYGTTSPFMLPAKAANDKAVAPIFPNPRREVLYYYGTIGQKVYQFAVSLIIPDQDDFRTVPYLESQPVMLAMDTLTRVSAEVDRPDPSVATNGIEFTEKSLSAQANDVIAKWASAYAQDDKDTLKRMTGDNSNKVYNGIGGFALVGTPSVDWSYEFQTSKRFIVASVTFSIVTKSSIKDDDSSTYSASGDAPDQFISNQRMVLLIENADAGVPNISAWGPPGSWNKISPYQNGVVIDSKNIARQPIDGDTDDENGGTETTAPLESNTAAPTAPKVETPKTTTKKKTTPRKTTPKRDSGR